MCTYGEGFKPLVDAAGSKGWEFINEGKPGAPKWGYISTQPGSTLKIRVNSLRGQQDGSSSSGGSGAAQQQQQQDKKQPMNVMLAYLKSYEGMGMASFQ